MQYYLLFIAVLFSCSSPPKEKESVEKKPTPEIVVTLFSSQYGGFGYDISVNGNVFVHQPNIPTVTGKKGFPTQQSARMVANLVIEKIKKNQIPPALSSSEVVMAMQD